jgi:hypothetical protein
VLPRETIFIMSLLLSVLENNISFQFVANDFVISFSFDFVSTKLLDSSKESAETQMTAPQEDYCTALSLGLSLNTLVLVMCGHLAMSNTGH